MSEYLNLSVARSNMITGQLRPGGVTDKKILEAMSRIPRETFVKTAQVGIAYADQDIRLKNGRYLLKPLVLARLLQAAKITPSDRVLELAPATGYSTVVLAALTSSIFSVESDAELLKEAEKNIGRFAPGKAFLLAGAPVEGCASHAPFDVIFINGSVEYIPEFLFEQLSEGGRVVTVVRHFGAAQTARASQARIYRKERNGSTSVSICAASAQPVPGLSDSSRFAF